MVICPYCEIEFDKNEIVVDRVDRGIRGNDLRVCSCPKCKKILSCNII